MGFFEQFSEPEPDPVEGAEPPKPESAGPPRDCLAGVVPVELLIAKSATGAIWLSRFSVYPKGFEVDFVLLRREASMEAFGSLFEGFRTPGEPIPPEVARLGIEFADGRRASSTGGLVNGTSTTVSIGLPEHEPDPRTDLVMDVRGSSGAMYATEQTYWVRPLPPGGPVTFVCEWPAFDIPETSTAIESAPLLEAASRAVLVWG